MQESADRETSKKGVNSEPDAVGEDSEATTKETLSDLEENQKNVGTASSAPDPAPAPDGAFDESKETGPI